MSIASIPPLIALTADADTGISADELNAVAAALQTQVTDGFAPVWHAPATVAAFSSPDTVPAGYWPIIVKAQLGEPGALGYHADRHHQPVAYVQAGSGWSVTASHELLEMLADPWGRRLVTCVDPRGADLGHARVLVEVCDPCEAFTYPVLGVQVSDFVEPGYYGSHHWSHGVTAGTAMSFLGTVAGPLQVAQGGYLSWLAADGSWWQRTWFDGCSPSDRDISAKMAAALGTGVSIREAVDRITTEARAFVGGAS